QLKQLKKLYEDVYAYPPKQPAPKTKYIACGKHPFYDDEKQSYQPCWKVPAGMTKAAQFGPCWDYAPASYKRYPLPAPCRGSVIPAHLLRPEFEHCETLYTRYDFQLEQCVHQQILHVERLFSKAEQTLTQAKELQIEKAKHMRYHAIRRRLLIGSSCGIKIYPQYLSQMAETRALCEFQKAHNVVNESNAKLTAAVMAIRDAMPELRSRMDKLDRSLKSPFALSLDKVLSTIQDLYNYFFEVMRKLVTWAQLLDAAQEHSVDDYLALLREERDFESFLYAGTEHCTCMRCSNKNPFDAHLPCWCPECTPRKPTVSLQLDNYICHKKIDAKLKSSDSGFIEEQSDTSLLMQEMEQAKLLEDDYD
ncbi:CG13843, partial [Drosophila busckii]